MGELRLPEIRITREVYRRAGAIVPNGLFTRGFRVALTPVRAVLRGPSDPPGIASLTGTRTGADV